MQWSLLCVSALADLLLDRDAYFISWEKSGPFNLKHVCFLKDNTENVPVTHNLMFAGTRMQQHLLRWSFSAAEETYDSHSHCRITTMGCWLWTVTCTHSAVTCTAVQIQKTFHVKWLSFLLPLFLWDVQPDFSKPAGFRTAEQEIRIWNIHQMENYTSVYV